MLKKDSREERFWGFGVLDSWIDNEIGKELCIKNKQSWGIERGGADWVY